MVLQIVLLHFATVALGTPEPGCVVLDGLFEFVGHRVFHRNVQNALPLLVPYAVD